MSFLTEYFDQYRQHPIRKTKMCRPENLWAELEGKWLDPKVGTQDKAWTDEDIEQFIKSTMKRLRGQSTYYNDFCAHFPEGFKTQSREPRENKRSPCAPKGQKMTTEEADHLPQAPKLSMKDTEMMKVARYIYERDLDKPTLKPLPTHLRILGYVRPSLYKTGISNYQESIARLAYELVRDDRLPQYRAHNGCRPQWGLPPEGARQPELDVAPYDGERLY